MKRRETKKTPTDHRDIRLMDSAPARVFMDQSIHLGFNTIGFNKLLLQNYSF